jgi:hypothetical protein
MGSSIATKAWRILLYQTTSQKTVPTRKFSGGTQSDRNTEHFSRSFCCNITARFTKATTDANEELYLCIAVVWNT